MALCRLFQNCAFGPDEIGRMTMAYEDTLRVLGLADRTDPITEIVAKKIIELVQTGERDPSRIGVRAIADLGIPPLEVRAAGSPRRRRRRPPLRASPRPSSRSTSKTARCAASPPTCLIVRMIRPRRQVVHPTMMRSRSRRRRISKAVWPGIKPNLRRRMQMKYFSLVLLKLSGLPRV